METGYGEGKVCGETHPYMMSKTRSGARNYHRDTKTTGIYRLGLKRTNHLWFRKTQVCAVTQHRLLKKNRFNINCAIPGDIPAYYHKYL